MPAARLHMWGRMDGRMDGWMDVGLRDGEHGELCGMHTLQAQACQLMARCPPPLQLREVLRRVLLSDWPLPAALHLLLPRGHASIYGYPGQIVVRK